MQITQTLNKSLTYFIELNTHYLVQLAHLFS